MVLSLIDSPKPEPPAPPDMPDVDAGGPVAVEEPVVPRVVMTAVAAKRPSNTSDLLSDAQIAGAAFTATAVDEGAAANHEVIGHGLSPE